MWTTSKRFLPAAGSAALALCAIPAESATIQDLARLKGQEDNVLTGMGLVVGLNGTGDSARNSLIAARPYAELLRNYGDRPLAPAELLGADSYAIVQVSMEIPAKGVREGDRLDVHVATMFNASSLEGARLVVSALRLPLPDSAYLKPMAIAYGAVVIEGANPRSGVVRGGGQMLVDVRANPISPAGTLGLVLKDQYAGYPVATTIAAAINDEFSGDGLFQIAVVEDAKNIKVLVPAAERAAPAGFIATLLTIAIDASLIQTEARIVINEKQGIILVTGTVEIAPVGITHKGLAITSLAPEPGAALAGTGFGAQTAPPRRWAGLDTTGRASRNSTRLLDLLAAFDQLMVPVQDQIAIIYELRKTGALHAEIIHE